MYSSLNINLVQSCTDRTSSTRDAPLILRPSPRSLVHAVSASVSETDRKPLDLPPARLPPGLKPYRGKEEEEITGGESATGMVSRVIYE
jgi:hypothetical protein